MLFRSLTFSTTRLVVVENCAAGSLPDSVSANATTRGAQRVSMAVEGRSCAGDMRRPRTVHGIYAWRRRNPSASAAAKASTLTNAIVGTELAVRGSAVRSARAVVDPAGLD